MLQAYVDLLIQEIGATASFNEQPLQTLYFGGGTPSLIPPRQLEQIMRALDRRFGIAAGEGIMQSRTGSRLSMQVPNTLSITAGGR
jgi:oxygen-independent coproporphyrinogen-3 oxidase